jgi:hypothetical protein
VKVSVIISTAAAADDRRGIIGMLSNEFKTDRHYY